jgi:hypothetical protein
MKFRPPTRYSKYNPITMIWTMMTDDQKTGA